MVQKKTSTKKTVAAILSKLSAFSPVLGRWIGSEEGELVELVEELKRQKFTGTIQVKFGGGNVSVEIIPRYPKDKMMLIYARYSNYYESKRNEYIGLHHSEYGADKFAVDETKKEIESKESVRVNATNLKQAMTRKFVRRPIRTKKLD